ncbi:MAG: hypothetical protein GWO07_02250 [Candidatus Dadabacteria bacterium]|nr:hypothetical protein [Candidatus Dadabacteria bacterium]NIS07590.1 hypothetical protein [Candidatus Dadabacteria bacterium]NIY21224.1 hypothetical protein [Candidatus Dadabacteria bacterium]
MKKGTIVSQEQWLKARLDLLEKEKAHRQACRRLHKTWACALDDKGSKVIWKTRT